MATDHSTDGHSPVPIRPQRNIFHIDNPEDVCTINPLIDQTDPRETFARIEGVLAMMQEIEAWRSSTKEGSQFTTEAAYGFDGVLAAARGALVTQVDILYKRAQELARGGEEGQS